MIVAWQQLSASLTQQIKMRTLLYFLGTFAIVSVAYLYKVGIIQFARAPQAQSKVCYHTKTVVKPDNVTLVQVMRGHDDERLKLDTELNASVKTKIHLFGQFVQTGFDDILFDLQQQGYVVIHQTWKSTCVLETKKKYMKSWENREKKLKVVFWTDETMEAWVLERFNSTYIYQGWTAIGTTRDAHIKKADVFRALLIWYYGGIYSDLDIQLKQSLRDFLKEKQTLLVWEPEESMIRWTEFEVGSPRKTLMLSGFLLSGQRFSDFVGFYVNWVVENHLSGRSKWEDHVVDATGPRVEAEAYYYYTGRIDKHDRLLHALTYPQFLNYAEHFSETTWVADSIKDIGCMDVSMVYSKETLVLGEPS